MMLGLCEMLERKRIDALTFFRAAYQHRFGKDVDVRADVLAWKTRQVVPDYVNRYVHHLQGEML
jgi:hypothetical protein